MITYEMIRSWAKKMILDARRKSRATAKRHRHLVGEQFKSIRHYRKSPSVWRHKHLGFNAKGKFDIQVHKFTSLVTTCIYGCGTRVLRTNAVCRKCARKNIRELSKKMNRVAPAGAYHTRVRS